MNKVYAWSEKTITIPLGEYCKIASFGDGVATVMHSNSGTTNLFPAFYLTEYIEDEEVDYGPYATNHIIKIIAGADDVEYAIGATPVLESVSKPLATQILSSIQLTGDVWIITVDDTPVDYTDGTPPATGEGVTGKSSMCIDYTNGKWYINSGTKAEPTWAEIGLAS